MKWWFLAAAFVLLVPIASAHERIVPVPAVGGDIAELARTADQRAEGTIDGGGRWLRITYASASPFVGFVVPFQDRVRYDPVDMLRFRLPSSPAATVDVDLSVSPSWNASPKTYIVSFASTNNDAPPSIEGIGIIRASFADTVHAFVAHAAASEDFVISTYHRLRGYRIVGHDVLPMLTVFFFIVAVGVFLWKGRAAALPLLAVAFCAHVLYGVRVDLDLTRLTARHAGEWFSRQTYAEAGSMYDLADAVRKERIRTDMQLGVCSDSTDYYAKLLRYLLLPIPVTIGTDGAPTHVAVVQKIDWSYEGGRLRCESIDAPAVLVEEFGDGSRLFALQ